MTQATRIQMLCAVVPAASALYTRYMDLRQMLARARGGDQRYPWVTPAYCQLAYGRWQHQLRMADRINRDYTTGFSQN